MSENTPVYLDSRDMKVVTEMERGKVYGAKQVRRAYKYYTDISTDRTAERRQRDLFNTPCMEYEHIGQFRFIGTDVEADDPL